MSFNLGSNLYTCTQTSDWKKYTLGNSISDQIYYIRSNTSILIQPGTYKIDVSYTVSAPTDSYFVLSLRHSYLPYRTSPTYYYYGFKFYDNASMSGSALLATNRTYFGENFSPADPDLSVSPSKTTNITISANAKETANGTKTIYSSVKIIKPCYLCYSGRHDTSSYGGTKITKFMVILS